MKTLVMTFVMAVVLGGSNLTAETVRAWMDIPLVDVQSGQKFTIAEIADKPILLEMFAVWCPTCTKQQKQVQLLHEELGDSFISISLDVDPNEDELQVLNHIQENGFDWIYAISPVELTRRLVEEYGIIVVSAPALPMLLIQPGPEPRLLGRGIKSVDRLKEELLK